MMIWMLLPMSSPLPLPPRSVSSGSDSDTSSGAHHCHPAEFEDLLDRTSGVSSEDGCKSHLYRLLVLLVSLLLLLEVLQWMRKSC